MEQVRQTASQAFRKLILYFHTWNFKVGKTLKKHMLSLDSHSKRALEKKYISVDKTDWQVMPCRKFPMKVELKPSE